MLGFVTVTTPPASSALTTLATAKADLGIADTSQDASLTRLISRASSVVADHCGRVFGFHAVSEVWRAPITEYVGWSAQVSPFGVPLNTKCRPLSASCLPVQNLIINENSDPALVAGADYELDAEAGLIWRLRGGMRSYWAAPTATATYSAGYTLPGDGTQTGPALPPTLEEVTLALVIQAFNRRGRDTSVVMDVTENVGRTQYAPNLSASAMALDDDLVSLLEPYRARVW